MKHKIGVKHSDKITEKEILFIPIRYILAIMFALFNIIAIIGIVVALCYHSFYFYFIAVAVQAGCVITIVASDDNPDYKIPWLMFVIVVPIVGFMMYLMFYSRKLDRKYVNRLKELKSHSYKTDDSDILNELEQESTVAASQARMICNIAETHIFKNTKQTYFALGEEMQKSLLADLERAESFIYMEYFIIEPGEFWSSVLEILKAKAASGVAVRLIYDDIGCMTRLPGNYFKVLRSYGIEATVFSLLRGDGANEFNNRSHRKITVIDGKIGYTGGINLADEYINACDKFGHFKDTAIRLEGNAVWELTKLFLIDYGINVRKMPEIDKELFPNRDFSEDGFVVPFGDGPRPIYDRCVGKSVIQNLLNSATKYVYMTTPYLVMDNELCQTIENASLRGVDVRIIVPYISDSKIIAGMGKGYYKRLIDAGIRIYEYKPGFIHAKSYLADGEYAVIGTMNLDYRSLVHNFENGVWMYKTKSIEMLRDDIVSTMDKCIEIKPEMLKFGLLRRFFRACVRIFAPML